MCVCVYVHRYLRDSFKKIKKNNNKTTNITIIYGVKIKYTPQRSYFESRRFTGVQVILVCICVFIGTVIRVTLNILAIMNYS